jgi:hypothetical protein
MHITELDFASITSNGLLCDEKGMLGAAEFEAAMRKEIRRYAQRQLADALSHEKFTIAESAQLVSLKMLSLAPSPCQEFWSGGTRQCLPGEIDHRDLLSVRGEPDSEPCHGGNLNQDGQDCAPGLRRELVGLRDELGAKVASLRVEMLEGISEIRSDLRRCMRETVTSLFARGSGVPVLGPLAGDNPAESMPIESGTGGALGRATLRNGDSAPGRAGRLPADGVQPRRHAD